MGEIEDSSYHWGVECGVHEDKAAKKQLLIITDLCFVNKIAMQLTLPYETESFTLKHLLICDV